VELHPDGFSRGLLIFVLGNQAWFMGAFFLIAGYFTPGSFDRKGASRFLGGRLVRLGIPLAFYALVLNPVSMLGTFFLPDYLGPLDWETYEYLDNVRMGPMWFVALLLIFSFGYATWRTIGRGGVRPGTSAQPGYLAIGAFVVTLAAGSVLMRLWIPVGEEWLGFPSLGYLPQYLSLFVIGTVAYRRDWFARLSISKGLAGLGLAAAATVLLFPYAFSGEVFSIELTENLGNAFGDSWHWQAAAYALWDAALVVGLSLFLIVAGRELLNHQGRFGRFLAQQSYTVYVVHIPIVVFLAVALRDIEMEHLVKFGMAAAIAVPLCFAIAAAVRRIPGVSRVL
jgi:fucose 4-O-acetylase-like acetyltransferase